MKVVFFGTSEFAAKIFLFLIEQKLEIVYVVTKESKISGSFVLEPNVKKAAIKFFSKEKILQPKNLLEKSFIEKLKKSQIDLFIVAAYGKILPKEILDIPKNDSINIHASYLPFYRGASPIHRCLLNGEKKTGVTIMKMVEKLDAGDIILQKEIFIKEDMNFLDLQNKLLELAKVLLLKTLDLYAKNKISYTPQDDYKATYANKIKKEEYFIDWNKNCFDIYNKIKAFSPSPGARCFISIKNKKKLLKIFKAEIIKNIKNFFPKKIISFEKDCFLVGCKDGVIKILFVQLEGKKEMAVFDFIKGIKDEISFL